MPVLVHGKRSPREFSQQPVVGDKDYDTSFPVLMQPLISLTKPLPIILKRMILVRGSSTCSVVARSDLSFWFAVALGPLRFTPTPRCGRSICTILDEYLERRVSWSESLLSRFSFWVSFWAVEGLGACGRLMAGSATVETSEPICDQ